MNIATISWPLSSSIHWISRDKVFLVMGNFWRVNSFVTVACGFCVPATAMAEADRSASSTINVTVVIAPIGAAVAAAREGAVGIWSISGGNRGLLIRAPSEIDEGASGTVRIFAQRSDAYVVRPMTGANVLPVVDQGADRGLQWRDFDVRANGSSHAQQFLVTTI
jgi:hypothetical protein